MKARFLVMMILTGFLNTGCFLAEITKALTGAKKKASNVVVASNNQNQNNDDENDDNNVDPGPTGPIGAKGVADDTWGDGGTFVVPGDDSIIQQTLVKVAGDGSVILAALINKENRGEGNNVGYCRLDENGALDETFGADPQDPNAGPGGCREVIDDGNSSDSIASLNDVDVMESDGSIFISGTVGETFSSGPFGQPLMFVSKVKNDGFVDENFGFDGLIREDRDCRADGEIDFVETFFDTKMMLNQETDQVFVRGLFKYGFETFSDTRNIYGYEADGSPILNFGSKNTQLTDFIEHPGVSCEVVELNDTAAENSVETYFSGLVELSPTGVFVSIYNLFGQGTTSPFAITAQSVANGFLDFTFGNEGLVAELFDINDGDNDVRDVEFDAEGRIYLLIDNFDQNENREQKVVRLLADGSVDATFGDAGILLLDVIDDSTKAHFFNYEQIEIDPFGQIYLFAEAPLFNQVGGPAITIGLRRQFPSIFSMTKYRSDGTRDLDFGDSGQIQLDHSDSSTVTGIEIDAQGRILISGNGPVQFDPQTEDEFTDVFVHRFK